MLWPQSISLLQIIGNLDVGLDVNIVANDK